MGGSDSKETYFETDTTVDSSASLPTLRSVAATADAAKAELPKPPESELLETKPPCKKTTTTTTTKTKPKPKTKSNGVVFHNDPDWSLVEVLWGNDSNEEEDGIRVTEALCIHVDPKACSRVVKELSVTLPLEDGLSHLKRVRRRPLTWSEKAEAIPSTKNAPAGAIESATTKLTSLVSQSILGIIRSPPASTIQERPKKRPKKSNNQDFVLEILIGTLPHLQKQQLEPFGSGSGSDSSSKQSTFLDHPVIQEFGPLHEIEVPKYDPRSEEEWKEHNRSWPTHYYPLKFEDHLREKQRQESALSKNELDRIRSFMERSISTKAVLIVDPKRCNDGNGGDLAGIVSVSRDEQVLQNRQQPRSPFLRVGNNPLATPILLALQGVSREERKATLDGFGKGDSFGDGDKSSVATAQENETHTKPAPQQHDQARQPSTNNRRNGKRYSIGTRIKKYFETQSTWYLGTIRAYDSKTKFYSIEYDDGDIEELEHHEIDTDLSELPNSKYQIGFQYDIYLVPLKKNNKPTKNASRKREATAAGGRWFVGTVQSKSFYQPKRGTGHWQYRVLYDDPETESEDVDDDYIDEWIEEAKHKRGFRCRKLMEIPAVHDENKCEPPSGQQKDVGDGNGNKSNINNNTTNEKAKNAGPVPAKKGTDAQQQQMQEQEPRKKQYICTGYDMYSFYEPTIFEAMACLHSRLRRLIYFVPSSESSSAVAASSMDSSNSNGNTATTSAVWCHGISRHGVHHLQGTNHNYRAFEYRKLSYSC